MLPDSCQSNLSNITLFYFTLFYFILLYFIYIYIYIDEYNNINNIDIFKYIDLY